MSTGEARGKMYDSKMMRRLWGYIRPHRALVTFSLVLLFAVSAVQLVQPYLIKRVIDDQIGAGTTDGLGCLALLFLGALIGEFVLRFAQIYVLEQTGQNVVFDLRNESFAHLQRLPSSFFDRNPVGKLMTRLTSDVEALHELFTSGVVMILADLVKLFAIAVILLWMDGRLALIPFTVIPPTLGLTWFFRLRMRETYRQVRAMVTKLNIELQENVSGMRIVQLFVRERETMDRFGETNRRHEEAQLRGVRYDSIFSALAELIGSSTLAAIIWAGGWGILEGWVTFGTLVAFIEYAAKCFRPVQELSQRYTVMQSAMAAGERIFDLLDTPVTIRSPQNPRRIRGRLKGEIVFDDVTFGYDPDQPVLHNVSFRIAPGERVGVVGWTGSGKSTLIRLLVRLYDIQSGRILVDGADIREYDLAELRRSIGVVLQDQFLFAGTVESNISLGDSRVTRDQVRAAAEAVRVHRLIEQLPGGYDEKVRERGNNFSTGEKQLFSFARAIAFDPAVLVLDEATASVDPETERQIQRALAAVMSGRTSILIAHRLATVHDADRILVLHHGRLIEQGPHEELIGRPDGVYRKLYTLQNA